MLSLISTLGGLLLSFLPKLLDYFQTKSDQKHELNLAKEQTSREMQLAQAGFAAQVKIEEIQTEQVAMQTHAQMQNAALDHDKKVLEKASTWVVNYVGTVRPTVTYILILELVAINVFLAYYLWTHPQYITNLDDLMRYVDIIFSEDEMAMLGGIIGFWFGSRSMGGKK
jgi:adenosylmethionine-8-amino-7-oxononanoate aminotransferase